MSGGKWIREFGARGNSLSDRSLLEIRNLSKSYGGVHALKEVSLDIAPGEVHALCGENGAGKSTLIKILTGVVRPDDGEIQVAQQSMALGSVAASERAGLAVMHQESTAFPDLNAIDNLFVGRELTRWAGWRLDRPRMRREASRVLDRLGERIDLLRPVGELPMAQRQMVAMARALLSDCRLLIMDEPTASLSAKETQVLLRLIDPTAPRRRQCAVRQPSSGRGLPDIRPRDGPARRTVGGNDAYGDLTTNALIQMMVGRQIAEPSPRPTHSHVPGSPGVAGARA